MGYTRYYTEIEVDAFKEEFVEKVKTIVEKAKETYGVVIRNWEGIGDPEISTTKISLNGDGSKHQDCETFILRPKKSGFECCKTRQEPYDMVVSAILKLARVYGYVKQVSSDGDSMYDEESKKLLRKVLEVK